jgi:hypothetical protein
MTTGIQAAAKPGVDQSHNGDTAMVSCLVWITQSQMMQEAPTTKESAYTFCLSTKGHTLKKTPSPDQLPPNTDPLAVKHLAHNLEPDDGDDRLDQRGHRSDSYSKVYAMVSYGTRRIELEITHTSS